MTVPAFADARVFVDTNVFVYLYDTTDPSKQARAREWIAFLAHARTGRLSLQVLQELYVTLTGKGRFGLDAPEVRGIVRELAAWRPVSADVSTLERAWFIQDHHAVSWWDALIVAAAQSCGCAILLTEDLQHGHDFDGVRVVNPFGPMLDAPARVMETHRTSSENWTGGDAEGEPDAATEGPSPRSLVP